MAASASLCVRRYQLGEGLEKKESDLAADVEEQQAALQAKAAEKKTQEPAPAAQQIPDQPSVKVMLQHLIACMVPARPQSVSRCVQQRLHLQ